MKITGTWFEFQHHHAAEGKYWNDTCSGFGEAQWEAKIAEIAQVGMDTIVLMASALHGWAFYPSVHLPPYNPEMDHLEALLNATDKYNISVYVGNGFWGRWDDPQIITDPDAKRVRCAAMQELIEYAPRHKSFVGWYWPNESHIAPSFSKDYINYVSELSQIARELDPTMPILIAPYGVKNAKIDSSLAADLENLDVDIIAYQDGVGVKHTELDQVAEHFDTLREIHRQVGRQRLWADLEIFDFEAEVYKSPLIPASVERIEKQLEAISPSVEKILCYQYLGIVNPATSPVFAGHPSSSQLHEQSDRIFGALL